MPKVSIIVPVYNVEPYLRQCMDSLVNQTLKDIEIIAVDDGSPDNCGTILDEYAAKDSRIKVIHKENGGLSAARNDGLKHVTGEYLAFVDSDDWVEPETYETAYNRAVETGADIMIFDHYKNIGNKQIPFYANSEEFISNDKETIYGFLLSALWHSFNPIDPEWIQGYPWNKIIRSSMVKDNDLQFCTNVKANEDVIFNLHIFHFSKKIGYVKGNFYHYRILNTSIVNGYKENRPEINDAIHAEMKRIGELYHLDERYTKALYSRVVFNFLLSCDCTFFHKNKASFSQKLNSLKQTIDTEPTRSAIKQIEKKRVAPRAYFLRYTQNNPFLIWFIYKGLWGLKKIKDRL